MNCMKCGREIDAEEAFCPICLELMEKCPIRPDVVVQLPNRQESPAKKATSRKRPLTAEEMVQKLKKRNRVLIILSALLLCAIIALTILSVDALRELDVQRFLGKNYNTAETIN